MLIAYDLTWLCHLFIESQYFIAFDTYTILTDNKLIDR